MAHFPSVPLPDLLFLAMSYYEQNSLMANLSLFQGLMSYLTSASAEDSAQPRWCHFFCSTPGPIPLTTVVLAANHHHLSCMIVDNSSQELQMHCGHH